MRLPLITDLRGPQITAKPVLIDLRNSEQYAQRHMPGACSVPLDALETRLFELPPPGEWKLTLLGSSDELEAARNFLTPKGWTADELDTGDPATWALNDVQDTNSDAAAAAAVEAESTALRKAPSFDPVSPYRPNSFLAAAMEAVELHASTEPGLAVDLGCGSGRDAVRS